jgi:HemY protein
MPGHVESALAVARAALDAKEFAIARDALKPLLKEPTQRAASLMAELEESESGDEGRAREWMSRALRAARDPRWTAEGTVSDRWMPVSPSGRLDAYQWKVPLAELTDARDVIEVEEPLVAKEVPVLPVEEKPAPVPVIEVREPPRAAAAPSAKPTDPARVEAVIPLVHVPDDPGPEPEHDPEPETPAGARGSSLS